MISHLPHFIEDKLIHTCDLNISRKQRSKLALIRNLQFYEVSNKQILNSIDLQYTILRKIQYKLDSIEPETNEAITQSSDIIANSRTCPNKNIGDIIFGKYIYFNRTDKIVYILIKCWNYMVVLKRNLEGFCLQAEFEDVKSFQVTKIGNYQAQVSISFLHNDGNKTTNFQEISKSFTEAELPTADVYRKMLEKIKKQQSEVLVHQTISIKEFSKLKSTQLFGSNFLRTPRLEELQILSKCGNSWIKLTPNDDVVIGVPLVNNCSSRLTILRNFRAVLQGVGDLFHSYKLYQLNKSFCDIESIQSIFNVSESGDKYNSFTNCSWRQCFDVSLLPETFSVLVLKLKIQEICVSNSVSVPLFVFYDVCTPNKTFNQKCFLTTIFFGDIFSNNSCKLLFDENNLHRDLLAIIASSYETEVRLEYIVSSAAFEDFLCQKLGFHRIFENENFSEAMDVDGQDDDADFLIKRKVVFFNKMQNSIWHGTMLEIAHVNETSADIRLFTKCREKSKILLKLLRTDLKAVCGIKDFQDNVRSQSTKLIEFEAALRDECCSYLKTISNSAMKLDRVDISKKQSLHNDLHSKELRTDLLFKDLLL